MKKLLCTIACALLLLTSALAAEDTIMAPSGILATEDGAVLFTDVYNHAIWEIEEDGSYTKLAGRDGVIGADNRPMGAYHDDSDPLNAAFNTPWDIAPFGDGYAITDSGNNVVRYLNLSDGTVTTLAGSGSEGAKDDTGTSATFDRPTGLVSDGEGGLYVADSDNHLIRYIDASGVVTTYAGSTEGMADGSLTAAKFCDPTGLAYADGVLYVADTGNHRICKIVDGQVTTLVGGTDGYADGSADTATLSGPTGVYVSQGIVYIADSGNSAIRCVVGDVVTTLTVAGDTQLFPITPRGLLLCEGTLWVCDVFSHTLSGISGSVQIFSDVATDAWYASAIYYMKSGDYMQGTSTTTFEPNTAMSRAMFVQVLYNMEGAGDVDYDLAFSDTPESWYSDAVRWACAEGIANGTTETTFGPNDAITREQMVTMLYRYVTWQGIDTDSTPKGDLEAFPDGGTVTLFAIEAMEWANGIGVINGTYAGTLLPLNQATRAETATMLMNFLSIEW